MRYQVTIGKALTNPTSNFLDKGPDNVKVPNATNGGGQKKADPSQRKAEDYDEQAAKLWSVYTKEAESHDKALVETWKDDMEGILIFVCNFGIVVFNQNLIPLPPTRPVCSLPV